MYCSNCGMKIPENAGFCSSCGCSVKEGSGKKAVQKKRKHGTFRRLMAWLLAFFLGYGTCYITYGPENISDAQADTQQQETQEKSGYIKKLDGHWEETWVQHKSYKQKVYALSFEQPVYNCTGFTVNMNAKLNAGSKCKDWQVWGRCENSFVRLEKIHLPEGSGATSKELTFDTPITFDSIAVTPSVVGNYTWSVSLSISDVWTK